MLQNKIYQNFLLEILKNFFSILFVFSLIALTVRAVNFLDLIVDNGYPVSIYFSYSILNLFGLAPKFIPLSFLIALLMFLLKHKDDGEFIILWSSGVSKLKIIHLLMFSSLIVLFFYLIFSIYLSPLALNKSRQLLSNDKFNSLLPTVKSQQFSDSFKGLTFIVEKKVDKEIQNVFLHDTGNNLQNLSSNTSNILSTTVIAKRGIVEKRKLLLVNGKIISNKKDSQENELISFDQLNIDLENLVTNTIKTPKIQETSTKKIIKCSISKTSNSKFCNNESKKEILPNLIRRVILPFYIPVVSLICSFILLRNDKFYLNKFFIFLYSFIVLIFTELSLRYTGISNLMKLIYICIPFILIIILYSVLKYNFSKRINIYE